MNPWKWLNEKRFSIRLSVLIVLCAVFLVVGGVSVGAIALYRGRNTAEDLRQLSDENRKLRENIYGARKVEYDLERQLETRKKIEAGREYTLEQRQRISNFREELEQSTAAEHSNIDDGIRQGRKVLRELRAEIKGLRNKHESGSD